MHCDLAPARCVQGMPACGDGGQASASSTASALLTAKKHRALALCRRLEARAGDERTVGYRPYAGHAIRASPLSPPLSKLASMQIFLGSSLRRNEQGSVCLSPSFVVHISLAPGRPSPLQFLTITRSTPQSELSDLVEN
ncbi:predicted protein [Plenodomus lingam JN3]|uniref:Predicted protein n=1 Tax=Leptosphaeria maculans (strain JN3 / isolate v23.1.3 / race Av1-4-5-6-7-8) TaxID=985895 RepID=E5ADA9_LEPMJ|nr:predicted protein [Plenodomus lingam JN3]CBY02461.1 predicted protein [Plenodomus lingam JN3]